MDFLITQNFINGLPQMPYRNGIGNYEGVVCHSTANNGDSAIGERNFESNTYNQAFVHFFVDDTTIIQTANTSFLAFGCCYTGNQRFVQVELCETSDQGKFLAAYEKYVWLLAKILFDKKLGVHDGVTLWSHKQVSDTWRESDHQDPIDYLASHGISWQQHVFNVNTAYQNMCNPFQVVKVLCDTDIRADHDHTSAYIKNAVKGEMYNGVEHYGNWVRVLLDNKGNKGWIDSNNGQNLYWVNNPALKG